MPRRIRAGARWDGVRSQRTRFGVGRPQMHVDEEGQPKVSLCHA